MYAKDEVSISYGSKVVANVKVDNRHWQTDRQDKNNMPPIIQSGGIKIAKARSIWYSGGGLGSWSWPENFFRTISEQDNFFAGPSGRIIFFITKSYKYRGFRDNFMLNNGFRDNYMVNSDFHKAFATNSHSIQVFETTSRCNRNNQTAS